MSREAFTQVLASLAAAISLLERGGKKAAASDRMFEQMLDDYRAALEAGRNALSQQADQFSLAEAAAENWVFVETVNNFMIERGLLEVTREDGGGLEAALNVTDSIAKLIERMRQEVSVHRAGADAWKFKHDQMKADRAACWAEFKALVRSSMDNEKYLNEQIDSLRPNAERYVWYRDKVISTLVDPVTPEEFDAALDDARLEKPDVSPA